MKWVNVKKQLPKDDSRVLVHTNDGQLTVGEYYTLPNKIREWYWDSMDYHYGPHRSLVTHWAPLPKPPTE